MADTPVQPSLSTIEDSLSFGKFLSSHLLSGGSPMAPVLSRHHGKPIPARMPAIAAISAVRGSIGFDQSSREVNLRAFDKNLSDLVAHGADLDHFEPFSMAVLSVKMRLAPFLPAIRRSSPASFSSLAMRPPMHFAVGFDNLPGMGPEGVAILARHGASPDSPDAAGVTPAILCSIRDDADCLALLLSLGANLSAPPPDGVPETHPLSGTLAAAAIARASLLSPDSPFEDSMALCLAISSLLHGERSKVTTLLRAFRTFLEAESITFSLEASCSDDYLRDIPLQASPSI